MAQNYAGRLNNIVKKASWSVGRGHKSWFPLVTLKRRMVTMTCNHGCCTLQPLLYIAVEHFHCTPGTTERFLFSLHL